MLECWRLLDVLCGAAALRACLARRVSCRTGATPGPHALAGHRRCCLLCYERQPHHGPRAIIAERLDLPARHLLA
jgi:hypothetical protein